MNVERDIYRDKNSEARQTRIHGASIPAPKKEIVLCAQNKISNKRHLTAIILRYA